ncbi:uncharacterized protein LOC128815565 [Vidua macroura]|uniref:uncharacterized protein LOC128815565 n=1 Tax=Vidua macroura TaxID=187451 RepID=UPI0023A903CA|nr:uncharacterized protein LOC128815565 [Vidua macroura]
MGALAAATPAAVRAGVCGEGGESPPAAAPASPAGARTALVPLNRPPASFAGSFLLRLARAPPARREQWSEPLTQPSPPGPEWDRPTGKHFPRRKEAGHPGRLTAYLTNGGERWSLCDGRGDVIGWHGRQSRCKRRSDWRRPRGGGPSQSSLRCCHIRWSRSRRSLSGFLRGLLRGAASPGSREKLRATLRGLPGPFPYSVQFPELLLQLAGNKCKN